MKKGNWIPICKSIVNYFPKVAGPPYSKPEAIMCLQIDYDNNKLVSENGYARLWKWSRRQVRNLMNELGIYIKYEKKSLKNQRGQINILQADKKRTNNDLIRFIDSKDIDINADKKRTKSGQITEVEADTTIYPINNNPNPIKKKENIKERKKEKLLNELPDIKTWEPTESLVEWSRHEGYDIHELKLYAEATRDNLEEKIKAGKIDSFVFELRVRKWITSQYNTQDQIDAIKRRAARIRDKLRGDEELKRLNEELRR